MAATPYERSPHSISQKTTDHNEMQECTWVENRGEKEVKFRLRSGKDGGLLAQYGQLVGHQAMADWQEWKPILRNIVFRVDLKPWQIKHFWVNAMNLKMQLGLDCVNV